MQKFCWKNSKHTENKDSLPIDASLDKSTPNWFSNTLQFIFDSLTAMSISNSIRSNLRLDVDLLSK
ncbi:hypothetical protein BpHYR1_052239 [Brachionus plicatilis]|uniref:Uncharacterized protein n=1 Tax=Brachionus plicatilis TaxID=10195 RepID=A0A3M7TBV3_BRAPC|nr:hypothetical protein BpHYR1_052239 [Brachionus plicatilis]